MARDIPPDGDYRWHGRIARLWDGTPIEVDPGDMIGSHILRYGGVWEPETASFFLSWLRPGMTFVDAGAHVGYYTLLASNLVGAGGRVIAFEPHPVLGQVLRRNTERAGCANVTVSSLALGRASGTAELVLHPRGNFGGSSLRADGEPGRPRAPVEVTTLDDYLERSGVSSVDVVKLDVEGAEPDVIEGARRTLAANPGIVLVVEFLRENARRFGRDVEDLEARLRELGFLLLTLTPYGPRRYERVGELAANIVAVRRLITLLSGLPEPVAAATLVQLAQGRHRSASRAGTQARSRRAPPRQGSPQPGGSAPPDEGGTPAGQGPAE